MRSKSRGENQKGVSDIFGEMDIYIYIYIYTHQMKALNELFLPAKVLSIHECKNLYYKQLKSVHKVRSNYGKIVVLALL